MEPLSSWVRNIYIKQEIKRASQMKICWIKDKNNKTHGNSGMKGCYIWSQRKLIEEEKQKNNDHELELLKKTNVTVNIKTVTMMAKNST